MIDKTILTFLLFWSFWCQSQNNPVQISILTCAPGQDIYSIYGHNAIRVLDKNTGTDLVYNYGTFDFKTKGFAIKFMLGKLPYTLDVAPYDRFLMEYNYFQRAVNEQVLNIDSTQTQNIITYLAKNMQPENRTYKYDFFMDNCATRLRDIIDKNIATNTWDTSQASGKTFRQIIKEYQKPMPWLDFGVDLIIGSPADQVTTLSEETFIPDYLLQAIEHAKDDSGQKLEKERFNVLNFENKIHQTPFLLTPYALFLFLLLFEIWLFIKKDTYRWIPTYDRIWISLLSFCSLLMLFMWFCTDHIPTKYNWNVLWANPLIIFWYFKAQKNASGKWIYFISLAFLSLALINAIPNLQILPQYFHPIVGVIALILIIKMIRIQYKNNN